MAGGAVGGGAGSSEAGSSADGGDGAQGGDVGEGGDVGLAGTSNAGAAGNSNTDPKCAPFAHLTLTNLKETKAAGPGQTALFSATLTNLSGKFIDYTGGTFTCQERGTLIDEVSIPNWSFGILAHGTQALTFSARISGSAPSGATLHCTAHAGLLGVEGCENAAESTLEFQVK